jgi:hypothetical protein
MIPPNTETPRELVAARRPECGDLPASRSEFLSGSANVSQFVRKVNIAALILDKGSGHARR